METKSISQLVVIHGGNSYPSEESFLEYLRTSEVNPESFQPKRDWKSSLEEMLDGRYEFFAPRMPNAQNAHFTAWSIWFERMFPFLRDDLTLVGHSLGGIFLVKFLAEKVMPVRVNKLILVAAPFCQTQDIGDFTLSGHDVTQVQDQCKQICLFHSQDDQVVSIEEMRRYESLFPQAKTYIFSDRGHFNQQTFPEIIRLLLSDYC